jgi:hypothetical protein
MFPHPEPLVFRAPRWRAGLRHALDVAVAFATLGGVERHRAEPPVTRLGSAGDAARATVVHRGSAGDSAQPPPAGALPAPATAAARALAARRSGREAPVRPAGATHPHRRALRAPARSRRPGAVRAAPQPCLTPPPLRHTERGRRLVPSR